MLKQVSFSNHLLIRLTAILSWLSWNRYPRHFNVLLSKKELGKLPPGPKVVLASMASLEEGFSRDIFVEWATDAKNLIIFTERGQLSQESRLHWHSCSLGNLCCCKAPSSGCTLPIVAIMHYISKFRFIINV
eukprot:Gb_40958 [translate_table: standard]